MGLSESPARRGVGIARASLVVVSHVLTVAIPTAGRRSPSEVLVTSEVVSISVARIRSSPVILSVQHLASLDTALSVVNCFIAKPLSASNEKFNFKM